LSLVVTGATGFVGRRVVAHARQAGLEVLALVRRGGEHGLAAGTRTAVVPELDPDLLASHFQGASAVVHLANIGVEAEGASYEEVNAGGTRAVVAAAQSAGVGRVVYLSGLGVTAWGRSRRVSNRYFLSKLEAELALFASGLEVAVLRPSFILGPGGELIQDLVRELSAGRVEIVGDGAYRMQPVAIGDAADAVLRAATREASWPLVFDLVGPEPIRHRDFIGRVAARLGTPGWSVKRLPVEEAEKLAAEGGYRGMGPEALDCLLCDEVAAAAPLEQLLGRRLQPLDAVIGAALGEG
jgi:NADH dehydrogenase